MKASDLRPARDLMAIYYIQNTVNQKIYIGSAVNWPRRVRRHKELLNKNEHYNKRLQNAWNAYGEENFLFGTIEYVENPANLIEKEQYWINHFNSYINGYNSRPIANSNIGLKFSAETKAKMAASQKKRGPEHAAKLKGRKTPKETKLKLSIALKGKNKKPIMWPHENGNKCKCDNCRAKILEQKRQRYLKVRTSNREYKRFKARKRFCDTVRC